MAKDTFWFKHDHNARTDKEIMKVRMKMGMAGVGLFWCIVEMLHEEGGYLMRTECERIAFELHAEPEMVASLINNFDLFKKDEEKFWSKSVLDRLDDKKAKSEKARESANYRHHGTNDMRTHNERDANTMLREEKRGEENKNQKKIAVDVPPPHPPIFVVPDKFYLASDMNGLPTDRVEEIIRFVRVVQKREISKDDVIELWEIFKTQNLVGTKPYLDKNDVYRHFFNTSKKQSFRSERKTRVREKKSDEKIIGVEYLNDYMQCRMSDDSIQELTPNQRDSAKFQGIKPSVIVKK